MSLIRLSCALGVLCVATWATAASNPGAEKPVPLSPEAMHERLAQISQDPPTLAAAIQRGQKEASVCRHCHGIGGNSVMPEVPNLASQNAAYLLDVLDGWNLDETLTRDTAAQLCDELPGAATEIMEAYRLAIVEGRLGN